MIGGMQYANELFFAISAVILLGLAWGSRALIQIKRITQAEYFWYVALLLEASSFLFFAIASTLSLGLLTLANVFLIAGYMYLALYFRSLNQPISQQLKWLSLFALLLIGLTFQYLMQNGTFVQRVSFVIVLIDLLLIWQLIELKGLNKSANFLPKFLILTIIAELILASTRLFMLFYIDPPSAIHLYQEPFLTTAVRWAWFAFAILSYVAIIGYRVESVNAESAQMMQENNSMKLDLAQKKAEQSEFQLLASLNALAKARDNETGNHIIRTQNYVKVLALRLRHDGHYTESLSDQSIDSLFKAAPLHDIGKIGIPDHILLKKGSLTSEEWEIMKTHSLIGESVLITSEVDLEADHDVITTAIKIAGSHHEKWDGGGYPRGLVGEAIPLAARIMSLADMYDALVNERVYKKAWTHEEAVQEILSKRNTQFDPFIVDAFIAEQSTFQEIAIKYRDNESCLA